MKKVIVVLNGGLGNQLFQWFFAHTIPHPEKIQLDLLFKGEDIEEGGQREFKLEDLMVNCDHVFKGSDGVIAPLTFSKFWHLLNYLWLIPVFRPVLTHFGYYRENPNLSVAQNHVDIDKVRYAYGFYQNFRFMHGALEDMRDELDPIIDAEIKRVKTKFKLHKPYSVIHVRQYPTKGYVHSPVHFSNLSEDYFLNWNPSNSPKRVILVTEHRDQIENLISKLKVDLVLDSTLTTPWETLAIMAGSNQLLGSNSSLSWWGAWLSSRRKGECWLPSQWSYWENVDVKPIHFESCKIIQAQWDISGFDGYSPSRL